jgi:hypothetical protein
MSKLHNTITADLLYDNGTPAFRREFTSNQSAGSHMGTIPIPSTVHLTMPNDAVSEFLRARTIVDTIHDAQACSDTNNWEKCPKGESHRIHHDAVARALCSAFKQVDDLTEVLFDKHVNDDLIPDLRSQAKEIDVVIASVHSAPTIRVAEHTPLSAASHAETEKEHKHGPPCRDRGTKAYGFGLETSSGALGPSAQYILQHLSTNTTETWYEESVPYRTFLSSSASAYYHQQIFSAFWSGASLKRKAHDAAHGITLPTPSHRLPQAVSQAHLRNQRRRHTHHE